MNNNRIIKRIKNFYKIAAYIDKQGNINENISYDISNNQYELLNNVLMTLNKININYPYKYTDNLTDKDGLAIYGDSFKDFNGNNIDIEFHIKKISAETDIQAYKHLDNLCDSGTYSLNAQLQLENNFENYRNSHFILGIFIIFKNGNQYKSRFKYFSQNTPINTIKSYGQNFINHLKNIYF